METLLYQARFNMPGEKTTECAQIRNRGKNEEARSGSCDERRNDCEKEKICQEKSNKASQVKIFEVRGNMGVQFVCYYTNAHSIVNKLEEFWVLVEDL